MRHPIRIPLAVALATALAASAAGAADVLGQVSSVTGEATAQRPGEEPRALACGDEVYADDTLRTGANSRLGVLLDDVMTHLAPDTQVALGRTPQATPAARLEAGKVRMIDPRDDGAAAQLAALDATAEVVGNDAEAYVIGEKIGPYAMLCEWDAPLPVRRAPDEALTAEPGECVISRPREPLYTANAHDERIPVDVAEICEFGPELAQLSSPLYHLTPRDVAAPPPPPPAPLNATPDVQPAPAQPCTQLSSGCSAGIPIQIQEPPPVVDGPPGPGQ